MYIVRLKGFASQMCIANVHSFSKRKRGRKNSLLLELYCVSVVEVWRRQGRQIGLRDSTYVFVEAEKPEGL